MPFNTYTYRMFLHKCYLYKEGFEFRFTLAKIFRVKCIATRFSRISIIFPFLHIINYSLYKILLFYISYVLQVFIFLLFGKGLFKFLKNFFSIKFVIFSYVNYYYLFLITFKTLFYNIGLFQFNF